MKRELQFSIILPICHGSCFLRNALLSAGQINFPSDQFEVLVAGTKGDEESPQIVANCKGEAQYNISYIGCVNSRRSAKLNAACSVARGRWLAFADDDCLFLPNWLQKLSEALQCKPDVGIVGGQDEIDEGGSTFKLALDCALNSLIGTGGLRRGVGIHWGHYYPRLWNMAIPRSIAFDLALEKRGGVPQIFNESLMVHEDVDLAHRIAQSGRRILFAPEVRIKHCRESTFHSFVIRNFNMARTSRSRGVHRLPHTMLSLFMLTTLTLTITSIFLQPARIFLLMDIGIYMVALLTASISGFRRTGEWRVLALLPILLMSLHFTRGLGYLFPWTDRLQTEGGL